MKQFVILLSMLVFSLYSFGQIANDDNAFFNYTYNKELIRKNKIEEITVEIGNSKGKYSEKKIYYFSKEGLLTKQSIFDSTGTMEREIFFVSNSHNDIKFRIQKNDATGKTDTVRFFKSYNIDKLIADSSDQIPINYNYEYDNKGLLVRTIINSNFGLGYNSKRIITNNFDSSGRIINITDILYQNEKDIIGSQTSNRDIFYSKNGKIEKEIEKINSQYPWMFNKGSVSYLYDKKGNLIQISRQNAISYAYTYNKSGLITTKKTIIKLEGDDISNDTWDFETIDKYHYSYRK